MKEYTDEQFHADLKRLAKKKGFGPLTPEEAQKAYDEAMPIPLSKAEIKAIVDKITGK